MSEPGSNLARVLRVWAQMLERGSMAPLRELVAQDVVWQGLAPELVCRGRDEVARVLGSARGGRLPRVTRMAAEEVGDRVVVTVEGPDLGPGPAGARLEPPEGARTLVLSFEDGAIVRMDSFTTREEALGAPA